MAQKPGSIVHIELHSSDPAKSKNFYGHVFGWKFQEMPQMNYALWQAGSEPGGGLMQTMEGRPPQVLNYILSTNIDTDVAKVGSAGGLILQPKTEIPGPHRLPTGWWALFQEPGGTVMALYQGMTPARPPPRKRAKKGAPARKAKRTSRRR